MGRDEAVKAVVDAVRDAGPQPGYHARVKAEVWRLWPTLGAALDGLLAAIDREDTDGT